jgi:putative aldouronate transport system permease protein
MSESTSTIGPAGGLPPVGGGLSDKRAGRIVAKRSLFYRVEPYLFVVPALLIIAVFHYYPMIGLQLAFKDYIAPLGIWGSPWVGLEHITRFFRSPVFVRVVTNTIAVSFGTLLVMAPLTLMFALGLNEIGNRKYKGLLQTISYAPHFVSIVVIVGMIFLFTSPTSGLINTVIKELGGESVHFMVEPGWFLPLYIISQAWQYLGWGSIIYLAGLSRIDPELHEAAIIDGATRVQRIIRINLPYILPIFVIQLIIQSGRMLQVGFEKVFLMQTALNQSAAEVLSTYTYKIGIQGGQFSYATSVGLVRAVVSLLLILTVNRIAKRLGETSLW